MLTCIDLFAGAGGFSFAARKAKFDVRLAIENDKHAVSTYKHNLCGLGGKSPLVIDDDICSQSPTELYARSFADGEVCDLLLGGPPCQGFSTHRIKGAGVADARNDLIHTYFDFVRAFRPRAFLMENVPGMLWPRHADYLRKFLSEGRAEGYHIYDPIVLDARDFGVPQRRKRVFILGLAAGVDNTLVWPPKATHGSTAAVKGNSKLIPWTACADVFVDASAGDSNDVHMRHTADLIEAFRRTPPNGGSRKDSGRVLACHQNHDGHKDVYGRIDPEKPAPTMTTACINPSKGRFVHPTEPHGITARQAARIQTFPESYVFKGGLMAAGRQIGNAVPVALGHFLIDHIRPVLESASPVRTRSEPAPAPSKAEPEYA